MAEKRIPTSPSELVQLLQHATTGISSEPNWPASGPTSADVNNMRMDLDQRMVQTDLLVAQLAQSRENLHNSTDSAYAMMKNIDSITDGLYGPDGPKKLNYGLPPKKTSKSSKPLTQVVIKQIGDGNNPASIVLNWEIVEGAAAYQVEWYTDANLTVLAGNAATSKSEIQIDGLVAKTQYWFRIRAIRGEDHGAWSDRATRVANI